MSADSPQHQKSHCSDSHCWLHEHQTLSCPLAERPLPWCSLIQRTPLADPWVPSLLGPVTPVLSRAVPSSLSAFPVAGPRCWLSRVCPLRLVVPCFGFPVPLGDQVFRAGRSNFSCAAVLYELNMAHTVHDELARLSCAALPVGGRSRWTGSRPPSRSLPSPSALRVRPPPPHLLPPSFPTVSLLSPPEATV